jgi:hypothetical protein
MFDVRLEEMMCLWFGFRHWEIKTEPAVKRGRDVMPDTKYYSLC